MDHPVTSFADERLEWYNGKPGDAHVGPDGNGLAEAELTGSTSINADGELVIAPAPQRDYWCRTFYTPTLVKSNG